VPYAVAVSIAMYDSETAGEIATAALSGATMLLVPLTTNALMKVEAVVMWHGEVLQRLKYELPFSLKGTWSTVEDDVDSGLAESIASHIVRDLQQSDTFSPSTLRAAISSSDYDADLNAPVEVGNFHKLGMTVLGDPFLGAGLRYQHAEYEDGHVDVFVYPINDWQFELPEHLETATEATRKDQQLVAQEGHIQNLVLDSVQKLTWPDQQQARSYSASYNAGGGQYKSETVLFTRGDKFVKIRATFSAYSPAVSDVAEFAQVLARTLVVPEESLFMARVRKEWRDSRNL